MSLAIRSFWKCSISKRNNWKQSSKVRFGMLILLAAFAPAAQLPSQTVAVTHGALEITSGLGRKLYALPDDQMVVDARKALVADPKNVDLVLQLSKAQAARRQYKEAVATSTQGLALAPKNADLYLERGHRELGLREFKPALKDLEQATSLAPGNLDAYYHLGLAHYFLGEFDDAAASFDKARALAKTNDSLIDCSNWLYVSLERAGKPEQAAQVLARITPEVKNTEPHLLFYLRLLHFYNGQLTAEAVLPPPPSRPDDLEAELAFNTISYGVGNWRIYHHNGADAIPLFRNVVKGEAWNSWGFIGSELELLRSANNRPPHPIEAGWHNYPRDPWKAT
jgi:tetratricopeptide (TPR) repeat protein